MEGSQRGLIPHTVKIADEDKVYFVNVALGDGEEKEGPRKEVECVNKKEDTACGWNARNARRRGGGGRDK